MRATWLMLLIFNICSKEPLTKNTRHYALNCVIFSSVLGPDIRHNILPSDTPNKRFFLRVKIRTHFVQYRLSGNCAVYKIMWENMVNQTGH